MYVRQYERQCGIVSCPPAGLPRSRLQCPKCPSQSFPTRAAYDAHIKAHTKRTRLPSPETRGKAASPYKLVVINGQRVWQRQPEPRQGKGGLSPLAEPLDPKKWKGKKTVFDESQKQQTGRHPCLVHGKVGCRLCARPTAPKPNRSSTYRKRFVKK